jgi:hypothetical protein
MMLCILKVIVAWAVLAFVGTNLIGLVVRGSLWSPPTVTAPTERVLELLRGENRRVGTANTTMTIFGVVATLGYVFALFHYWGVGLTVAGCVMMAARIPDLAWELRTGDRIRRHNAPKTPLYTLATIAMWGTLPLIWYSLCKSPT